MPTAREASPPPWVPALTGPLALLGTTLVLLPLRDRFGTATIALLLVLPGVLAGMTGGRWAAVLTGVAASIVLNIGFLPPYGELRIHVEEQVIDLVVFSGVALLVGALVALERDRRRAAEDRTAEVEALDRENAAIRTEQQRLEAQALGLALAGEHRSALLRAVSHDLRTPLATIRAVSSDLRDQDDYAVETRHELLDLVTDEAERLDRLVSNLLSLSRVEAGALVPECQAVPLEELFEACVRRHARLVRSQRLSVVVPVVLPLVDADWTLVDQVLTNLLANAVRHSPPGSSIELRAIREDDRWVRVSVSDNGPGIPADLRKAVFTPFRTGPGSSSSGIGLAIARAIVEAHGGAIALTDNEPTGTVASFTLPVHRG